MYPLGKIKDETIGFLKQNYLMLLVLAVVATIVSSFGGGILGLVVGIVQSIFQLPGTFMQSADSSFVVIIGSILNLLIGFVFTIVSAGVGYFVGSIVLIGVSKTLMNAKQTGVVNLMDMLYPIQSNFKNIALIELRKSVEIVLWSLLFVVPGIIKTYEYFMVDYLLADNPNLSQQQVFSISKAATHGDKLKIFGTQLLAGLIVSLGFIACCVGQFFLMPITYIVGFEIYLYLKAKSINMGIVKDTDFITLQ